MPRLSQIRSPLSIVKKSKTAMITALRDAGANINGSLSHISSPFREDTKGSLSIYATDHGNWRWKDHGGTNAEHGDIVDVVVRALGITDRRQAEKETVKRYLSCANGEATLPDDGNVRSNREPDGATGYVDMDAAASAVMEMVARKHNVLATTVYAYTDVSGEPTMAVVRIDHEDGKDVRPLTNTSAGWKMSAPKETRPLYGLDRLENKERKPVLVVEGESCVDAAQQYLDDYVVTTSSGGAKAVSKTDWSPLAGRDVVIWPDNDGPGMKYAADVSDILQKLDPPCQVKIIKIPVAGLEPQGADVADLVKQLSAASTSPEEITAAIARVINTSVEAPTINGDSKSKKKTDLAAAFLDSLPGAKPRFHRGAWYEFDGGAYSVVPTDMFKGRLLDFLRSETATMVDKRDLDNVLLNLKTPMNCLLDPADSPPLWINEDRAGQKLAVAVPFTNGVLLIDQLENGVPERAIIKSSHDLFVTNPRLYDFDPTADCPVFKKFLECVQPDLEIQMLLQEMAGLLQVLDTSFEVFFILVGDGANGKSTLLRILVEVLGRTNVCSIALRDLGHRFRTFSLTRRLANIVSESVQRFGRASVIEDVLKTIVSGEPITVEEKYGQPISAPATARIVVAANEIPVLVDRTQGVWRRAVIVPFDVVVPPKDRDRHLATTIVATELPGVFNWALEGLLRLRARGHFEIPERCLREAEQHRLNCAPEEMFMSEYLRLGGEADFVVANNLYAAYRTYISEAGHKGMFTKPRFGMAVKRAFPEARQTQRRDGGKSVRGYTNLTFDPNGHPDATRDDG